MLSDILWTLVDRSTTVGPRQNALSRMNSELGQGCTRQVVRQLRSLWFFHINNDRLYEITIGICDLANSNVWKTKCLQIV